MQRVAIVGGGPAGLMAAEVARAAGTDVEVFEGKGSVGRKFLIAGKGGLNLTHSEPFPDFVARYGSQQAQIGRWLSTFNASDVRKWVSEFGIDTFVGTSGRVFPQDLKAAPLLRGWVRRLRSQGVRFSVNHYCTDIVEHSLRFETPAGDREVQADAIVLAMGGGSWSNLGSDGRWVNWLTKRNVDIAPLLPANCGFDVQWSDVFANRFAGQPMKSIAIRLPNDHGAQKLQGEFVITKTGIEGSLIYALSAKLRDAIARDGNVRIELDLVPDIALERLQEKLAQAKPGRSVTETLRRTIGIEGAKMGLVHEYLKSSQLTLSTQDYRQLAAVIKALPVMLLRARPIDEAISSAGGVRFAALTDQLMIKSMPGVFCAGEMIDWEAPTGGYLLTASFASGRIAGRGAVGWLHPRP